MGGIKWERGSGYEAEQDQSALLRLFTSAQNYLEFHPSKELGEENAVRGERPLQGSTLSALLSHIEE